MILRLRHAVTCEYAPSAAQAAHLLRLRPRALAWQRVVRFGLSAAPRPEKQRDGVDHFGNPVTWLFHDAPQARVEVATEAVVELLPRPAPSAALPWEQVADAARNKAWAWREAEFAFPSPLAPALPGMRAFAAPSFPPGRAVAEGASCLARRVGEEFRTVPGVTALAPLARVVAERVGSRRDLGHLLTAGLRSMGLPARSVAGYAFAAEPYSARLDAWTSCWLGPGLGWFDLDAADAAGGEVERLCLGWGRDHGDFSPLRGILPGAGPCTFSQRASLERLDAEVRG